MGLKTAAWFITIASLIQIFGFLYALPEHLDEASWSAHAQFHHVLGWLWVLGLDSTIITLAWIPLQRRENWAFWLLVSATIFAQVSFHLTSQLLVPEGRPPEVWHHLSLAVVSLMAVTGLVMAWRALNPPK